MAAGSDHGVDGFAGQCVLRRYFLHRDPHVACVETVERDLTVMRAQRPVDVKFRPRRTDEEKPRPLTLLKQELDQFQRGGIRPIQILDGNCCAICSGVEPSDPNSCLSISRIGKKGVFW
jgi:hypothetical protein